MKKRTNEAMWVENAHRWQINVTNDDGVRKTFVCATEGRKGKVEAEHKADNWLSTSVVDGNARVDRLFEIYINSLKDRGASATHWKPYKSIGDSWIIPVLGRKKICKLAAADFDALATAAYVDGKSKKYIKNICCVAKNFLKFCRKRNLTTLIVEDLIIPDGAPEGEKFPLQPSEIKVLMKNDMSTWRSRVVPDFYIHFYRFAVLTGLRPSELCGLQKSDFSGLTFTIKRGVNVENEVTKGKNKRARRVKKMNTYAAAEYRAQMEMLRFMGIESDWVFPGEDGGPSSQENIRNAWYRYCKHNGIAERETQDGGVRLITPYELRHTYSSVTKDMPEGLKKLDMGHSDDFDGDATYTHILDGDLNKMARFSDAAFGEIFAPKSTPKSTLSVIGNRQKVIVVKQKKLGN